MIQLFELHCCHFLVHVPNVEFCRQPFLVPVPNVNQKQYSYSDIQGIQYKKCQFVSAMDNRLTFFSIFVGILCRYRHNGLSLVIDVPSNTRCRGSARQSPFGYIQPVLYKFLFYSSSSGSGRFILFLSFPLYVRIVVSEAV